MKITPFFYMKINSAFTHLLSVLLFFSVLYTLFFSPVIFSNQILGPTDGIVYFVPAFYSPRTLWTNLLYSGYPVAADPQVQTWYPVSLFFSLIPNSWNAFILSAYIMASSFTYAYVYKITNSKLSALVSGLIYGMSAALVDRLVFANMVHTVAWLPLVLWGLENLRGAKNKIRWISVTSLAIGCMFLAGHPQSFIYSMGVVIAYTIVAILGVSLNQSFKSAISELLNFIYIGILSILVVAIALIPQLELAKNSIRANMPFAGFIAGSFHPLELLNIIFPFLFGGYSQSGIYSSYFGYLAPHENASYAGLLSLLLIISLGLGRKLIWQARFWLGWIAVAVVLAMGGYTPFARFTFLIPGYNIVRGSSRHTFEIALAIAILSGFGVKALFDLETQQRRKLTRQVLGVGLILGLIATLTVGILSPHLTEKATSFGVKVTSFMPWSNPATGIPLLLFILSLLFLGWIGFAQANNLNVKKSILVALLTVDLASASWFGLWHYVAYPSNLSPPSWVKNYSSLLNQNNQRLSTVEGIVWNNQDLYPNISRLWNIPNLSGYGPLILSRYAEFLNLSPLGDIAVSSLLPNNSTLDLLASRYITLSKQNLIQTASKEENTGIQVDFFKEGVGWSKEDLNLILASDAPTSFAQISSKIKSFNIDSLSIVSFMSSSTDIPSNTPVINVTFTSDTGEVKILSLKAGKDTSEWAYDQPNVKSVVKHSRAKIFDDFFITNSDNSAINQRGHRYIATLPLSKPQKIQKIQLSYVGPPGTTVEIDKISLNDGSLRQFHPLTVRSSNLSDVLADSSRWNYVGDVNETLIFENLRAMPRVWLVPEVVSAKRNEVLTSIRTSKLPSGRIFNPSEMALVEEPIKFKAQNPDLAATAKIIKLLDRKIEIEASSSSPSYLVLSDIYYPGWKATVDGEKTQVFKTNFVLRGIVIPAGKHLVKFEFKPISFHLGVGITAATLVLLGYMIVKKTTYPRFVKI